MSMKSQRKAKKQLMNVVKMAEKFEMELEQDENSMN